jgi:hypothetical protein
MVAQGPRLSPTCETLRSTMRELHLHFLPILAATIAKNGARHPGFEI